MADTVPISSGFVRGGANANPNWFEKFGVSPSTHVMTLAGPVDITATPKPILDISATLLESEKVPGMDRVQAVQSGFTGDQCDNCGSMRMKVSGHCNVCEECGTSTGCS